MRLAAAFCKIYILYIYLYILYICVCVCVCVCVLDCMYSPITKITYILTFPPPSLEQFLRAV